MQSGVDEAAGLSAIDGNPHQAAAATRLCWPGAAGRVESPAPFGLLDAAALSLEVMPRLGPARPSFFQFDTLTYGAMLAHPCMAAAQPSSNRASRRDARTHRRREIDHSAGRVGGQTDLHRHPVLGRRSDSVGQGQHQVKPVPHFDYVRVDLIDLQHAFRARTKTGIRLADNSNGSCLHFSVSAPGPSAVLPVFQLRLRKAGGHGSLV
ncbi:hypothetical protein PaG_01005 [Moesziomyces aphidis]|uniref:Uncharacterized protein n=1 Tax=Moesziomyces aphidis TaxID=84754 RepID=W3VSP8_MOEAP|nr:hypothetical protein PaG_01005 [Moesziomyces aphidis]